MGKLTPLVSAIFMHLFFTSKFSTAQRFLIIPLIMPTPTPAEDEDETKSRSSAPAFLLSVHQHGRTSLDIDIDETSEDIILLLIGICFGADRHQP